MSETIKLPQFSRRGRLVEFEIRQGKKAPSSSSSDPADMFIIELSDYLLIRRCVLHDQGDQEILLNHRQLRSKRSFKVDGRTLFSVDLKSARSQLPCLSSFPEAAQAEILHGVSSIAKSMKISSDDGERRCIEVDQVLCDFRVYNENEFRAMVRAACRAGVDPTAAKRTMKSGDFIPIRVTRSLCWICMEEFQAAQTSSLSFLKPICSLCRFPVPSIRRSY